MSRRQRKVSYWQEAPMPREQLALFPETIDGRIPEGHPVRLLDEILDSMDWEKWEAAYHGSFGQPPIHPKVMCKAILFGMIRRIRKSRELEYNIRHSIDFMWLVSGRTIDHTTLSEFRRAKKKELKDLYRQIIQRAIDLKLARLSDLCIDGTRVLADANRFKTLTAKKTEKLLAELDRQISLALAEMDAADELDNLFDDGEKADQLPEELRDMQARKEKLQSTLSQLQEMDTQRKREGKKNSAQLPVTDPDSRILPNKTGGYAPNYTPMAVTELENGFIVCPEVLVGNVEHTEMLAMLDTIEEDFGDTPNTVMADGAYSTGPNLEAMENRGIEFLSPISEEAPDNPAVREDPTQPVAEEDWDRLPINAQTKRLDKQAFVFDEEKNVYYCPAGEELAREGTETYRRSGMMCQRDIYRSPKCFGCALSSLCRKNSESKLGRKVTRDTYESVRDRHRERMQQEDAKERYKQRQHFGETPFAVLKAALDLRRFLLRGIDGVRQEWLWGCLAYNFKKLMSLWEPLRAERNETMETAIA